MKLSPTLILKLVIILAALGVISLLTIAFPLVIMDDKTGYYKPLLIGMYIPAIPFFIAIFQAFKLLKLIEINNPFSNSSEQSLKKIKHSAFTISALYLIGSPYIFYVAQLDDAPGVVLICLIIIGASFVIGVFAGVLQKLLRDYFNLNLEEKLSS